MTVSFFASPGSIDAMKLFMMLGIERTAESVCGQQRGCWVVNTMVDGWSIVCDSVRQCATVCDSVRQCAIVRDMAYNSNAQNSILTRG